MRVENVEGDYVEGDKHEHGNGYRAPSEHDPHRICPQCRERAWLYTDLHQTCGFNLAAYDAEMRRQAFERRKTIFLAVVMVVFLMAAAWMKYIGNTQAVGLIMFGCLILVMFLSKA